MQKWVRASILPVHLSIPWGLTIGPWPHLPIPSNLRYRLGEPVYPDPPANGEEPSEEQVLEVDAEVRRRVQGLLDELAITAGVR